jgi:hypothetical protein
MINFAFRFAPFRPAASAAIFQNRVDREP